MKKMFHAYFQLIFDNPEYKKITKSAYKKTLKYYWVMGLPFFICCGLLLAGIDGEPSLLQTSTIVSFTMFGVIVGLLVAHESIGDIEKLSLLIFYFPKADKKELEKIFTGHLKYKMDIFMIVSYFTLGLVSSIAQSIYM